MWRAIGLVLVIAALLPVQSLAAAIAGPGGGGPGVNAPGSPGSRRRAPAAELERSGSVPVYLQVAQLLRQEIMGGGLRTGDALPGDNALMAAYSISSQTARAAVRVLREEGLIVTRRGSGSFVAAVPPPVIVQVTAADTVSARMPTPAERRALAMPEGAPVLVVQRPGLAPELFDAGRARVEIT